MLDLISKQSEYLKFVDQIENDAVSSALGLLRSARLPMIASLHNSLKQPIIFVVERMDQALSFADELSFWMNSDHVMLFPEPSPTFYEKAAWGSLSRRDRLQTLTYLSNYHKPGTNSAVVPKVIITTVRGLMTRTIPRRDLLKSIRTIKAGQDVKQEELVKEWVGNGYQASEIVVEPGYFSRRGGLLDIWSVSDQYPVRIDFFGNEIF